MQTISEVLVSSQEVFRQDIPKQAPTHAEGASSRPKIARIRDVRGITPNAKFALLLLHSREPNIFPSMQLLAADMGSSIPTAKRAVRALKRAGYLQVIPRIGKTNLYSITVAGDPPPLSPWTPPPGQADPPPPVTHDPPPPVTHDPPPRSPMTPEVTKEVYKGRKERESKRTLSPGIQSIKETLTCPQCERSWPARFGSVCHTCNMDIATIQRHLDEGKQAGEKSHADRVAEIEAIEREMKAREQASKREEDHPPVQKPQAEQPTKESLEAEEAALQGARKEFFDKVGKL